MSAQLARTDPPEDADAPEDADRQFCCSMTTSILRLVREHGGDPAVADLLARAASKRSASYLEDANNWISLHEAYALMDAAVQISGDPHFARRAGEETVRQHAGTQVATLLRSLGSVEACMQTIAQAAGRFTTITEMEAVEVEPGRAVIRAARSPARPA